MATKTGRSQRAEDGVTTWRPPEGWPLAALCSALIYGAHLDYAGLTYQSSLLFSLASCLILLGVLAVPARRAELNALRGLLWPGLCFLAVIAAALLSLTPYGPGGPAPVWSYIGVSPGSVSINRTATIIEIIKLLGLAAIFALGGVMGASDGRARRPTRRPGARRWRRHPAARRRGPAPTPPRRSRPLPPPPVAAPPAHRPRQNRTCGRGSTG